MLELLSVVPFLAAIPALFHELAHSTLLHSHAPGAVDVALGASELLMMAILPLMLYHLPASVPDFIVSKPVNWIINIAIFCLIVSSYIFYREGDYHMEKRLLGLLVVAMVIIGSMAC